MEERPPRPVDSVLRSEGVYKEGPIFLRPPFTVRHGFVAQRISRLSHDPEKSALFLKDLERVQDNELGLVDVFYSMNVVENIAEANHLREHWFPEELKNPEEARPYWPGQPVQKTMVNGLVEAFGIATDLGFSVHMFWMVYGEEYNPVSPVGAVVDTRITKNTPIHSVLFMIATPPPHE